MKNYLGTDERIPLIASAQRTSGVPCIEGGWAGVPETDAASGVQFALLIKGRVRLPTQSGVTRGGLIYITSTGTLANASASGSRPFARVYAVGGTDPGPNTGESWCVLSPQSAPAA